MTRHLSFHLGIAAIALLLCGRPASAQIGAMVSPGPLSRAHASLEGLANCQKCHEAARQVSATRCLACHKPVADRIRLKKGVHRNVTTDCVTCHVEHMGVDAELRPFDPKTFDHAREAAFPLDGRHAPLTCERCHKTRSFLTIQPACSSCHKDVHKGQLGTDCARCHPTSVSFKEARTKFDHTRTRFALTGAHVSLECAKCHTGNRYRLTPPGGTPGACASCHKTPHRTPLGNNCGSCHTTANWKTEKIDHDRTGFPLKGLHGKVPCAGCHRQPATRVALKPQRCADCHADPHRGQFKQDCAACHNEQGFRGAPFDHTARTKFPLDGAHVKIPCSKCHTREIVQPTRTGARQTIVRALDYSGLKADCASCHKDVHGGEAGADCRACHGTTSFKGVTRYKHKTQEDFFGGLHANLTCAQCHATTGAPEARQWRFKSSTTACASCHRDPHLGQLGTSCERCHAVSAAKFAAPKFSHATATFPLTGKHVTADCVKCHKSESAAFPSGRGTAVRYRGVATACASCHQDTHLGQLGKKCELCHNTDAFTLKTYTHVLRRELFRGKHATLECSACHKRVDGVFPDGRGSAIKFVGFPGCASCHEDVHRGTFGGTCENCHTVENFRSISRAFHKGGTFALEGRHLAVPCASCHVNGEFKGTPTTCFDCHWIRRQDDRYHLRLGSKCEQCHRPISWTATTWSHVAATGVALNPTHRILGCDSCHRNLEFRKGLGVDCASCHRQEYERTTEPNHMAAGFPMSCEVCHKPSDPDWHQARFDHRATFPLVGQHATTPCQSCHRDNVYRGTPRECWPCHEQDYAATRQPNHAEAGFPTNCEQCHRASDQDWHAAVLNHDKFFRLVGVHRTTACTSCHQNGVYKGTPRDCVGCHRTDYDRTQNPNHAAAGFSTDCQICHKASDPNWQAATFNHDSIYKLEGRHRTAPCASCHPNGRYEGTPRECVACHRSDYDRTRDPNHAAAGFPTNCSSCHRAADSSWDQGRFQHSFPRTGPHNVACTRCHINPGNYHVFSCTVCHGKGDTDEHHKEVSGYKYESTACYSCHPNGRSND